MLASNRYSTSGVTRRKAGVVIHDSESPDGSAASLIRQMGEPGTRPLGGGRFYGSGYHALTLNTPGRDDYEMVADRTMGPFHAPPLNKTWWGICIPGYVRQARAEWLDGPSLAGIRAVAWFIIEKAAVDGFPLEYVDAAGLKAGRRGYTSHYQVSLAFGQTNHTDPGPEFPWDVLAAEIALLAHPIVTPPPTTPSIEELIMSGSFTIIGVHSSGAKAFISKGPAGTEMTGLTEADVPVVQSGFAAANGGRSLPTHPVSDQLWDACFADGLISKGYATGGKNASGAFAIHVNSVA